MISFQVNWPVYLVMDKLHSANSVNPKPFRHGNTELSSTKVDKCVESINRTSQREDDVLRTTGKLVECHRNDGITYLKICGNSLRAWYSDFAVPKYDWLVNYRRDPHMRNSRHRSRYRNHHPSLHFDCQVCTGSFLN